MPLKEILLRDMKSAMKNKETVKKDTIQLVRAAVLQIEKDEKTSLDDDQIIQVIAKEVKKRRDSLPEYQKSHRDDLVNQLNKEIEFLLEYLPEQLSEDEVYEIVQSSIKEIGATSIKDMGEIMQVVMPKVQGRADGRMVNQSVKRYFH
jgi:uncharacterized protein YqeY